MDKITFKSLFDVSKKVQNNLNYYFDNDLDNQLLFKMKQLKQILDDVKYVDNASYRKTVKTILNLFLTKDFVNSKNLNIDLLTLITKDKYVNKQQINNIDIVLKQFTWFNDWINFTRTDLSNGEYTKLLIKYIRKELNNNNFVRHYRDTDYYEMLDDIFNFINSKELDHYPLLKAAIIVKQLLFLNKILKIDVLFITIMFILKKYCLDMNSTTVVFIQYFFNSSLSYEQNVEILNNMNLEDFFILFKNTLINSIDFCIVVNLSVKDMLNEIKEIKNDDIDLLYPKEFKNLLSHQLIVEFPKLYLDRIYFTRNLYNQKMEELCNKGLIEKIKTQYSYTYVNKKMLDLIYLIDYRRNAFLNKINK